MWSSNSGPAAAPSVSELDVSSNRTWPALEEEWYDGWLLRAAAGSTRRANSVSVVAPARRSATEKLDYCQAWFEARRLPPIFRLTPLSPPDLEPALRERGYRAATGATVMVRTLGPAPDRHAGVSLVPWPTFEWFTVLDNEPVSPADAARLTQMWAPLGERAVYALRYDGPRPVAIGMGVLDGGLLAIFNMRTDTSARRLGHGSAVIDALLDWGRSRGASHAYLQVRPDNPGAHRLYQAHGFRPRYDYRYRIGPAG